MGVGKSILETVRVLRGGLRKDVLESSSSHLVRHVAKNPKADRKMTDYIVKRYGSAQDAAALRSANIATHTSRAAAATGTTLATIAAKKYHDKKEADRQKQMYGW